MDVNCLSETSSIIEIRIISLLISLPALSLIEKEMKDQRPI